MRRYETIVIIDADIGDAEREPLLQRITELIDQYQGLLIKTEAWGMKTLAYEIRKRKKGHYTLFEYCGSSDLVNELERSFRINDRFLKYMTVLLDKEADADKIRAELEAAEAEKAAQAAEAAEAEAARKAAAEAEAAAAEAAEAQTEDSGEKTADTGAAEPDATPSEKEE
jgi:small subunit ribosomal protein S6